MDASQLSKIPRSSFFEGSRKHEPGSQISPQLFFTSNEGIPSDKFKEFLEEIDKNVVIVGGITPVERLGILRISEKWHIPENMAIGIRNNHVIGLINKKAHLIIPAKIKNRWAFAATHNDVNTLRTIIFKGKIPTTVMKSLWNPRNYSKNGIPRDIITLGLRLEQEYQEMDQWNKDVGIKFEKTFADYLDSRKVSYYTEHDLYQDGSNNTPDFYFPKGLEIVLGAETVTVYWIDVKAYFLAKKSFLLKSVRKQSARYREAFGPGAMVFQWGFEHGISVEDTFLIDWHSQ